LIYYLLKTEILLRFFWCPLKALLLLWELRAFCLAAVDTHFYWRCIQATGKIYAALKNACSVLCGALALGNPFPAQAWGSHFEQVRADAAKGDAKAQTALGNMYHDGFGVEKDIAKALEWYRKAVDQGYAEAQFRLGHEYAMGHGVTADLEVAVSLFKKAAAQGHGEAQYRLAEYYRVGRGVQKDMFESLAWYKKSADAGYAKAQEVVANYYHEKGEFPQVLTYLEKAAEQNSSVASYALGMMYLQ